MPDEPAQAVPAQDPQAIPAVPAEPAAPAQAAQAAQVPAPTGGHPWDTDLTFIEDAGVRTQVSEYLGTKWQPYVSQIEQSNSQAQELLRDFQADPRKTFLEVADELYGADAAKAIEAALGTPQTPDSGAQPQIDPAVESRDPEVQALLDWKRSQDEESAFNAEFERIKAANPDTPWDRTLFLPEVANLGDFDQAAASYKEKYGTYLKWQAEQAAATGEPGVPAPQALGTQGAEGTGTVPTEKPNQTLHEALDEFFDEQRAAGQSVAPPVPTG